MFLGSEPEKPDLSAFLMDSRIPEEVCKWVKLLVEMFHQKNLKKVKALDQKVQGLCTTAAGLVNYSSETMCGYGKVISALDIRQQVILRKHGPFVKPTSSQGSKLKPGA